MENKKQSKNGFWLSWVKIHQDEDYLSMKAKIRPGCCTFLFGTVGKLSDILFAAALCITIIGNFFVDLGNLETLTAMFIMLYAFCLHFLVNGRVYRYLMFHKEEGTTE